MDARGFSPLCSVEREGGLSRASDAFSCIKLHNFIGCISQNVFTGCLAGRQLSFAAATRFPTEKIKFSLFSQGFLFFRF